MRCCCRYWLTCCCCASMGARSIRSRAQVCLRSSSVLLRRWAKSTWSTWSGSGGENSNRSRPPSLTTITCHFSVSSQHRHLIRWNGVGEGCAAARRRGGYTAAPSAGASATAGQSTESNPLAGASATPRHSGVVFALVVPAGVARPQTEERPSCLLPLSVAAHPFLPLFVGRFRVSADSDVPRLVAQLLSDSGVSANGRPLAVLAALPGEWLPHTPPRGPGWRPLPSVVF